MALNPIMEAIRCHSIPLAPFAVVSRVRRGGRVHEFWGVIKCDYFVWALDLHGSQEGKSRAMRA